MSMDPPDPHDVTDFKFKALRRIRLGDATPLPDSVSLVCVASKVGLVAVSGDNCVHVVKTSDIEAQDTEDKALRGLENTECPKITVRLPGPVIHVAFSCDNLTLAAVVMGGMFPMIYLYDTRGLSTGDNPYQQVTLNTTSSGVAVTGLCWNPAVAYMFTITFDDGSMALYSVKDDPVCMTHPPAEGILAVSWSPKGKQLVAARRDGCLTQYKPDLREAKTIPGPPVPGLKPVSILWVSTYEFLVAYLDTSQDDARPGLWMVKGSKAGPVTYTNYDDICYSTGEGRKQQYSMVSIADWGMVIAASSGSMEVGVIGQEGDTWGQWLLEDSGRAELPLAKGNLDRFPTGIALDYASQKFTPIGDSTGPPSPILHVLSDDALLCSYYCVNTRPGVRALCVAPEHLSMEGKQPGTIKLHLQEPVKATPAPIQATAMPTPIQKVPVPALQTSQKSAEVKPLPFKSTAAFSSGIFNPDSSNLSFAQSTPLKPLPTAAKPVASLMAVKPLASVTAVKPLAPAVKETPKPIAPLATPKSVESTPKPITVKKPSTIDTEAEAGLNNAIAEELGSFQQELDNLRSRMTGLNVHIGNKEDKVSLKTRTEAANKFCKDVIETTAAQNMEIHALRSDTLEAFAWLEEARSRDLQSQDVRYLQLLRARRLDPVSQRKMSDLHSQFGYIEQQLNEANSILDSEWEEHVGNLKKGVRGERPARETIYKVLLNNRNIMESQRDTVALITEQVKKLRLANITVGWSGMEASTVLEENSNAEKELEQLALSLREKGKITEEETPVKKDASALKNVVVSPIKLLTPEKDSAIRNFLDNRPLSVVKAAKPESPSKLVRSSPVQVPSSKLAAQLKDVTPTPPKLDMASGQEFGDTPLLSGLLAKEGSNGGKPPVKIEPEKTALNFSFSPASMSVPEAMLTSQLTASKLSAAPPEYEAISPPVSPNPEREKSVPALGFGSGTRINFVGSGDSTSGNLKTAYSLSTTSSSGSLFESLSGKSGNLSTKTSSSSAKASSISKTEPVSIFGSSQPSSVPSMDKSESNKSGFSFATSSSSPSPFEGASKLGTPALGSTGSLFGGSTSKSSGSLFGSTASSSLQAFGSGAVSKPENIEASKPSESLKVAKNTSFSSAFGGGSTGTSFNADAASSESPFGKISSSTTASSIFGTAVAKGTESSATEAPATTTALAAVTKPTATATSFSFSTNGLSDTVNTSSSLLAATTSSTTSTKASIFAGTISSTSAVSSTPSVFGGTITNTSSASIFSETASVTPSSVSAFGGSDVPTTASDSSTTKASIFDGTSSSVPSASVFGGTSSTPSVFGGTASSASVFGGSSSTVSTSTSVFGGQVSTATTSAPIFGLSAGTAVGSIFGGSANIATTSATAFGGSATASTTSASVFGGSATASTTSASVFGGSASTATTSASVFGGSASTTATKASIFGGSAVTSTTSASVFGGNSETPGGSIFGSTPTSGAAFGGTASTASSSRSVFGASTTSASVFGGASSSTSVFGGAPATSASSVFGATSGFGATPAPSGNSVFGGSSSGSTFGAKTGLFGSTPSTSGSSVFGNVVTSTSSVFGASPATTTPGFGSAPSAAASTFGSAPAPGGSIFGGSTAPSGSVFGGSTGSNTGMFGGSSGGSGFLGGLGSSTPSNDAKKNAFGGGSTFGSSPPASGSIFGGSTAAPGSSLFGGGSGTPTFGGGGGGSGTFSTGGGSVQAQGFGSPTKPATPFGAAPAFGSPPAFGGTPAFGATPAFGSGATFGGGATFSSAAAGGSTFGSSGAAPFGAGAADSAPTFGSVAQNTGATFGGFGGASATPGGSAFGGGGTFGGGSFGGGGGTFGSPPSGGGSAFGGNSGVASPGGTSFNAWR